MCDEEDDDDDLYRWGKTANAANTMTLTGACQPLISFLLVLSCVVPSRSAAQYGLLEALQGRKHRQPYGKAAVASFEEGASTTTRDVSREVDAELEKRRLRRNQSIMLQINLFNAGPKGHCQRSFLRMSTVQESSAFIYVLWETSIFGGNLSPSPSASSSTTLLRLAKCAILSSRLSHSGLCNSGL